MVNKDKVQHYFDAICLCILLLTLSHFIIHNPNWVDSYIYIGVMSCFIPYYWNKTFGK